MATGPIPYFETPELLQEGIDDYFQNGVTKKKVIVGKGKDKEVIEIEVPTITGLCYHLKFESRQSFYDYEKRKPFSYTIKRARLFIEKHYEEMLQTGNTTGAIFALKNFNWSDKSEIDHTTGGDKITNDTDALQRANTALQILLDATKRNTDT